jgi:hypothetical protein
VRACAIAVTLAISTLNRERESEREYVCVFCLLKKMQETKTFHIKEEVTLPRPMSSRLLHLAAKCL